jgi:molecular chaperone GrpE (heat shock protein)
MSNQPPKISKWIFVFADLLLLAGCGWALLQFVGTNKPYAGLVAVAAIVGWMYGAWVCIMPWVEEFRAEMKFQESQKLASSLAQIQRIEEVATRIQAATGSWQSAQDSAARTATTAKEVHERIKADMKDFMEFSDRVNSEEKKHLQLEIDKLRKMEGDWVGVSARMLDHTFALTQAAQRSNQPGLATQLNNFQSACRDAARRMGLVPFHPAPGDPFDPRAHQVEGGDGSAPAGSVISDVLATGYTFQGQLLRRSLVRVGSGLSAAAKEEPTPVLAVEGLPEAEEEAKAEVELESEAEAEEAAEPELGENPEKKAEGSEAISGNAGNELEEEVELEATSALEKEQVSEVEEATTGDLEEEKVDASARVSNKVMAMEGTNSAPKEDLFALAEEESLVEEELPKRGRRKKPDPQVSLPF